MQYRFILDNQKQENLNTTLSGYNSYTGKIIFEYPFENPKKNDREGRHDGDGEQDKYLKSEELFLAL